MPPIWDLIAQRETVANAVAAQLREQIAELSAQLAETETELADLAVTRKTLTKLTGQTDADVNAATQVDVTIAGVAYQQILAVFTATEPTAEPMRAKDVCLALGLGVAPKDTEGIRAKLKRLTARQILVEPEPGLFALAAMSPSA